MAGIGRDMNPSSDRRPLTAVIERSSHVVPTSPRVLLLFGFDQIGIQTTAVVNFLAQIFDVAERRELVHAELIGISIAVGSTVRPVEHLFITYLAAE